MLVGGPLLLLARRRAAPDAGKEPLRHAQIPFGPFLAGAAVLYVFIAPRLALLLGD